MTKDVRATGNKQCFSVSMCFYNVSSHVCFCKCPSCVSVNVHLPAKNKQVHLFMTKDGGVIGSSLGSARRGAPAGN